MRPALLLLAALFALPAHADDIVNVAATADFNGVETFAAAFQYDATTAQVSSVMFSTSGLLGPFTLVTSQKTFDWTNAGGDLFQIYPDANGSGDGEPAFPAPGTYSPWDLDLACFSAQCDSVLGTGIVFGAGSGSSGSLVVTSAGVVNTSEPGTLALMSLGIMGMAYLKFRGKSDAKQKIGTSTEGNSHAAWLHL